MRRILLAFTVSALIAGAPSSADTARDTARIAAARFGEALRAGTAGDLGGILPSEGKVRLFLVRIGREQGSFAPSQIVALFDEFLSQSEVKSFDVLRVDAAGEASARALGRAMLIDRQGRPWRVAIHLALQFEDGRWVLREIKESPE